MTILACIALFPLIVCSESSYNYKYTPIYHLSAKIDRYSKQGWMSDPNGFCVYKGEYHLFYQYNPLSSVVPGIPHWGHVKSKDLVHWEHLPIALYPDQDYDKGGVFSGSVLVENEVMYLFYTGNVNYPNEFRVRKERQILATSKDGVTFHKINKNPIIMGQEYQPHIRDPKVWKHCNQYYMVMGNSFDNNTKGRVLLYCSKDKINWEQKSVLQESDGSFGYMSECPDLFELDGRFVLLFSPQGVKPQGDICNNLYSTGYILGSFDYKSNLFTKTHDFKELDHGHDFYATQTTVNKNGERIVVAWFGMWERNYPEGLDGSKGQMTLPRKLKLTKDGYLIQQPVREIHKAVGAILYSGKGRGGSKVLLTNNACKVEVKACKMKNFTLSIESEGANDTVKLSYSNLDGRITLDRGGEDGVRRTRYRPKYYLNLVVYIDSSSIEAFYGKGEVTFSSRFFPKGKLSVSIDDSSYADIFRVNEMLRTVPHPQPID